MVVEFERYGLARFRTITGGLQILGAVGLVFGLLLNPWLGVLAAAGLSLQMLLGVFVRLRIGDKLILCFPAFFYCCLNAAITGLYISRLGID